MQLQIPIRVEFEGTMLLETSKDFNVESLNRPIVHQEVPKMTLLNPLRARDRQSESHSGWCIMQQVLSLLREGGAVLSLLREGRAVLSLLREGGAESNEMHMILYSGVHNLQLGLLGVKPEDLTLKWNAAGCVENIWENTRKSTAD